MHPVRSIKSLPISLYDEVSYSASTLPEVFQRYGYDTEFAEECGKNKQFWMEVNARKVELEKTGMLHVHQAATIHGMSAVQLARMAMDPMTPAAVQLQIYQVTGKMGRLEPQNNVAAVAGAGFSISINLSGSSHRNEKTIENVIEHDELGDPPAYLSNLNRDLEYKG